MEVELGESQVMTSLNCKNFNFKYVDVCSKAELEGIR